MMSCCGRITRLLAAWSMLMATAGVTNAGMIYHHGTHSGSTVTFADVTEDNDSTQAHYGSFDTIIDTLTFDPISFGVQDNDLVSSELLDSELMTMIVAHDGFALDTLSFGEVGDYTIVTEGSVGVSLAYFWEINEVDGNTITPITGSGIEPFSAATTGSGLWDVSFVIDLPSELADFETENGVELGSFITKATLRFDNTLSADGLNGGTAFIKKKTFDGIAVTTMVPEPGTLSGLLLGLCGIAFTRRRT